MRTGIESIDSTEIRMTMAQRIKSQRILNGLSQAELADRINEMMERSYPQMGEVANVKRMYVTRWEAGTSIPSTPLMACMTKIFQCSAAYLCGLEDASKKTEFIERQRIDKKDLPLYDGLPVFTGDNEYGLYNNKTEQITKIDGSFARTEKLVLYPADTIYANIYAPSIILEPDEAKSRGKVWIELIYPDEKLKAAYRGWYCFNEKTSCFEGKTFLHEDDHGRTYVTMKRSPFI